MKTNKLLSVVLALCMLLTVFPLTVLAEETDVAKIGDKYYATLAEAVKAAVTGDTVTLLQDVNLGTEKASFYNSNATNLTFDLDGHTITSKVSKNGTVVASKAGLVIKNGTIENTSTGTTAATAAIYVTGGGSTTLENVTLTSNGGSGLYAKVASSDAIINVEDNTVISGGQYGVYLENPTNKQTSKSGSETLNVNGGTITGTKDGVYATGASSSYKNTSVNVNITGGTLSSVKADTKTSTTNNDPVKVTVSGGTIEGELHSFGADVITVSDGTVKGDVTSNGTMTITGGTFKGNVTKGTNGTITVSGGTFSSEVPSDYFADGFTVAKNSDGTYSVVKKASYVAEVGTDKYETLQAAIDAAKSGATVKLLADTYENVTIAKKLTFDLNGFTLNGGTVAGKPALTVTASVTVKDSSEAQTGTIKREDTAENSGKGSHYVIDIQGNGWLTFEGGNVKNDSGTADNSKGASLVRVGDDSVAEYPGLNIKGGTFTQDNFIVIKVDRGDLFLNGGTLTSANSYAIENWHRTTIKGGTVNGDAASWTYSGGASSTIKLSGGTINGNVTAVNYGNTEDKVAKVEITGGTVTGELDTRSYDPKTGELTSIADAAKATIGVTGGTFTNDPSKYVVEDSAITENDDGTFGVEKTYLAKVGEASYYTMDEAQKAQTTSGEPIVLLRDYTTGSVFNSGYTNRVVDLNGHTWTYTETDADCAAFEINYSDVTLTVKNGTVVSNSMLGLIPSAMSGTITYDNAGLVFENVEATANGHSGIETSGNNTNDTVKLVNSTLNVPNGYGIYFASSGTLTLENSTINAKTMGVQVCAGSLSINDGSKITVTGDAVEKTENDGAIEDGAAISIVNRTGYKGLVEIAVTGGTFTAKEGNDAIKAYDWADKTETAFTESDKVAVSGGTFTSAVPTDFCAKGYAPKQNADGTYGVAEKAKVGLSDNMLVIPCGSEGEYYTLAFLFGIDSLNYDELGLNITICNNGTSRSQQLRVHTVYTKVKDGAGQTWEPAAVDAATSESHYLFAETMNVPKARVDEFSADAYVLVQPYVKDLDGNMFVKNSYKIPISYFVNQGK